MRRIKLFLAVWLLGCMTVTRSAAQTSVSLDVPFFSQLDARWKNNSLGGGRLTIETDGCLMTAAAMVLAYYNFNLTPATYNDWLTTHNGYALDYRFYWSKIAGYSNSVVDDAGASNVIRFQNEIDRGRPVIVKTVYPEHWVVIVGYRTDTQGNISYYVNDPLQPGGRTALTYGLEGVYHYITSSVSGKGFSTLQIAIGQFPPWGIAGRNQTQIQPKFRAMADEILTAYRGPAHPNVSIEPHSNNPGRTTDGKYVHEWVKNNDRLVVQDILIKNAGLTHERAMLVLAGDGSRAYVVKEGFYWLFVLHNTGIPFGNEELSGAGNGQVYQRFERAMAYWDNVNKVLLLKDYAQNVIARYTSSSLTVAIATSGDGTVVLDAPAPAPAPDPVIPITNMRFVIQPAESGYRYQLARGQERMNFVLRLDHSGGNAPLKYEFYDGATLITTGANPFCEANLGAGNHAIRARVEAGSGNNLRSSEVSQAILVEAAPKSDWGVPFEAKISTITNDGTYVYAAGVYVSGSNAGQGFLRRIRRSNPAEGQSYTFAFSFNEILPRDSYLFAATSSGLMVSRDQGVSWSTLYSNGQAHSIAILPGDKWNDWPIMILVGSSGGNSVCRGFWTPSEPNTLSNLLGISGLGPYTLVGGRRGNREWVFVGSSGPPGVQTQTGPYHLAYTYNSSGRLNYEYAGRAWSIFASDAELWVALKTNERPGGGGRDLGDNVWYNDDYGGSRYQKARGIPSGDDVVAFGWINSISGITRRGALYHAPTDPTQWRAIAGFSGELKLDLAAGQFATYIKRVGQDMLIGTEHGLRVIPVSRVASLAAAKPVDTDEQPALANTSMLLGNYPNPFNAETMIRFILPEAQEVRLRIYSITGSLVAELARGILPAGSHTASWEGARYGNGVYLCVLEAGVRRDIRKITLLK